MDVDAKYPALSFLARSQRYTLNQLGKGAHPKDDRYFKLADCCHAVLNDSPRWVSDPYNYLATLNELVGRFGADASACTKMWKKLVGGSPSIFLDTVVEAVWALHFQDNGFQVVTDKPFDQDDPQLGDADLLVTMNGKRYWLDAYSVEFEKLLSSIPACDEPEAWRSTREDVIAELADRAKTKYDKKFKNAVRLGPLKDSSVGVLLCVLKSEKAVIPQLSAEFSHNIVPSPPPNLFDDQHPGLDIVYVHALRSRGNSDLLQPDPILKWRRNQDNFL